MFLDADLNPTKSCQLYSPGRQNAEQDAWTQRKFSPIAKDISNTVGMKISTSEALTLMDLCVAEMGLYGKTMLEGVCQLFQPNDLESFSIYTDIGHYAAEGYADSFNSRISCSLFRGILNELHAAASNSSYYKSHVRLTHAETIIPLMGFLGLFKDPFPVNSKCSDDDLQKRLFRTSSFSPFMGNVIFELLNCGNDHVVNLRINEVPHEIPDCSPCTLARFMELYAAKANCDFDEMCNNTKPTKGSWRLD